MAFWCMDDFGQHRNAGIYLFVHDVLATESDEGCNAPRVGSGESVGVQLGHRHYRSRRFSITRSNCV